MVQINSLSFSFGSQILFENFSLVTGAKCACIAGNNGIGKSTLLKLAAGLLSPAAGSVKCGGETIYAAQECDEIPQSVYASFWGGDNETRKFYSMLGVTEEKIARWEELSGGEKKCLQIAAALAEKPAVLLLDEPSNHLDGATKEKIILALKSAAAQILLVCHDRDFADALCDQTIFLFRESETFAGGADKVCAKIYSAPLSRALELRGEEFSSLESGWQTANLNAQKAKSAAEMWRREAERSAKRLKKGAFDKNDRDAKRKIDAARVSGKDRTAGDANARLQTRLAAAVRSRDGIKKPLAKKSGFTFAASCGADYVPETILAVPAQVLANGKRVAEFAVRRAAKIAITGRNGSGKTLLVKAILREAAAKGRAESVFYIPQITGVDFRAALARRFDLLDDGGRGAVLSSLYRLNSSPAALNGRQSIADASPGELRKIAIAMSLCQKTPPLLYILDEPTNHLDLQSVVALEDALKSLDAALVIVSHDKAFLRGVLGADFAEICVE